MANGSAPSTCSSRRGWRFTQRRSTTSSTAGQCSLVFTVAVEFRNKTWFNSEKHTKPTLAFERDNGLVSVVVDEPQASPTLFLRFWRLPTQS